MDEPEAEIDVRAFVATLRRRAWVIVVCGAVFAVVAFLVSSRQPDSFTSVAQVRVTDPNAEAVFDGVQIRTDPEREVNTQILIAESAPVRTCAEETLGTEAAELDDVVVSARGQTDVLLIRAVSNRPDIAQAGAAAVADCYVAAKRDALVSEFQLRAGELRRKSDELGGQIADLEDQLAADPDPGDVDRLLADQDALRDQQQELDQRADEADIEAAVRSGSVELVAYGELPAGPSSPRPWRDAALAGALGVLVGIGLAFVLERLDNKVRLDDLDRLVGPTSVLGTIPLRSARRLKHHHLPDTRRELVAERSADAEAFRSLATSLRFSNLGREKRILAVTSASAGEGKSTVVANLAVALAESGQRVVVVSGDLRRPSLGEFFRVDDAGPGLTSVLLRELAVTDAVIRHALPDGRSLLFLPAGTPTSNPAELLGSPATGELLDNLVAGGADYVLVDSPPVLPVADTLALAHHLDGVLVVCVPGQTVTDHLATACQRLRQIGTDIVGVVVNGHRLPGDGYGDYGRYEFRSPEPAPDARRAGAPGAVGDDRSPTAPPAAGAPETPGSGGTQVSTGDANPTTV